MCSMKSQRSSADRISSLPEFIKHRILSYLPPKDSIKSSVLSNGWNSTWNNFPILDFRDHPLDKEMLLSLIDKSLRRFTQSNLAIQKLFIDLGWIKEDSIPLVDAWLPSALRSGVSELFFNVSMYHVPEEVFSGAASKGSFSKFFKLQNLSLYNTFVSEKIIRDITENCPNISNIELSRIDGIDSLEISRLHKLESLVITILSAKRILVNAQSLKSFTYQGSWGISHEPWAIDLTACRALKYLILNNCAISNDTFNLNISRFRLLETLFLSRCHKVQILRLSLPRLKVLSVTECTIKSVHIDAPTLSEFTLQSAMGEFSPFAWNVLAHCNMIHSDLFVHGTLMDSSWFVGLRRFLKKLTPGRMNLQISFDENIMAVSFDQNMIGEAECSSLVRVDHLDIQGSPRSLESISDLLEALLWSCRPKVLSCSGILAKILCKKLLQIREGLLCCSGINFKCWRHYLKVAKIDFIEDFSPYEKNGGIEYEQFRLALDESSLFWGDLRFLLEWGL